MALSWNGALCLFPSFPPDCNGAGWVKSALPLLSWFRGCCKKYQKWGFRSCPLTKFTSLFSRCATPFNKESWGFFFILYIQVWREREREGKFCFQRKKMHRTVFLSLVRFAHIHTDMYVQKIFHTLHFFVTQPCITWTPIKYFFFITLNLLKRFFIHLGKWGWKDWGPQISYSINAIVLPSFHVLCF